MGTIPDPNAGTGHCDHSRTRKFFHDWYAPVLMHPAVKALVLVWLCLYLAIAIWGCTQIRQGLKPVNLLVRDSYAIGHYDHLEKYFWDYGPQVQVVVNRAQNLSTPEGRKLAHEIVDRFANTKYTLGPDGVEFWLDEYIDYLKTNNYWDTVSKKPEIFYRVLRYDFLKWNSFARWNEDVKFNGNYSDLGNSTTNLGNNNDTDFVYAYRFIVGMQHVQSTIDQTNAVTLLREICNEYPHMNITTFMPLFLFVDQYVSILPNVLQDIIIGMSCMIAIALVFIPQWMCALWVALAIFSIDTGVIGK